MLPPRPCVEPPQPDEPLLPPSVCKIKRDTEEFVRGFISLTHYRIVDGSGRWKRRDIRQDQLKIDLPAPPHPGKVKPVRVKINSLFLLMLPSHISLPLQSLIKLKY